MLPVECNPYYITNCDNSALEWQSVWREDRAPWTSTEILEAWREVFASILWPLLRDMAMGALGGFAAALSVCWGLPAYWRWLTARSSL